MQRFPECRSPCMKEYTSVYVLHAFAWNTKLGKQAAESEKGGDYSKKINDSQSILSLVADYIL